MALEEIFDVVDAQDRVVTTQCRSAVHREGLRHRAVHMLVYNPAGELYLQKRSAAKDMNPDLWDTSAAGHLESGEAYDSAARRELGEELGLNPVPDLERLFKLPASKRTGNEFVWVYRCVTGDPINPDPEEISEGRWVSITHLRDWMRLAPGDFTPTFTDIAARVFSETGEPLRV